MGLFDNLFGGRPSYSRLDHEYCVVAHCNNCPGRYQPTTVWIPKGTPKSDVGNFPCPQCGCHTLIPYSDLIKGKVIS